MPKYSRSLEKICAGRKIEVNLGHNLTAVGFALQKKQEPFTCKLYHLFTLLLGGPQEGRGRHRECGHKAKD